MDGWNTSVSFWGPAYLQVRAVSFRESRSGGFERLETLFLAGNCCLPHVFKMIFIHLIGTDNCKIRPGVGSILFFRIDSYLCFGENAVHVSFQFTKHVLNFGCTNLLYLIQPAWLNNSPKKPTSKNKKSPITNHTKVRQIWGMPRINSCIVWVGYHIMTTLSSKIPGPFLRLFFVEGDTLAGVTTRPMNGDFGPLKPAMSGVS